MSEPRRTWPVSVLPMSRGRKFLQDPHHAEGLQTHVAEVVRPLLAFLELGPDLDLVANFAVAGQVAGFEVAAGEPPGRFEFRAEVFGLLALVHQPGGIAGHLATKLFTGHPFISQYRVQPKSLSKSLCEPTQTQIMVPPFRSPTARYCSLILTDQTSS